VPGPVKGVRRPCCLAVLATGNPPTPRIVAKVFILSRLSLYQAGKVVILKTLVCKVFISDELCWFGFLFWV
jgi:hypothetical protein